MLSRDAVHIEPELSGPACSRRSNRDHDRRARRSQCGDPGLGCRSTRQGENVGTGDDIDLRLGEHRRVGGDDRDLVTTGSEQGPQRVSRPIGLRNEYTLGRYSISVEVGSQLQSKLPVRDEVNGSTCAAGKFLRCRGPYGRQ